MLVVVVVVCLGVEVCEQDEGGWGEKVKGDL